MRNCCQKLQEKELNLLHTSMGCKDCLANYKVQLVFCILGAIAGLAALIVYAFFMVIPAAALFGGLALFYSSTLALEIWKYHNIRDGKYILPVVEGKMPLICKFVVSVGGMTAGVGAMIYFLTYGLLAHEPADSPYFLITVQVTISSFSGDFNKLTHHQGWMCFKFAMSWTMHLYRHHNYSGVQLVNETDDSMA